MTRRITRGRITRTTACAASIVGLVVLASCSHNDGRDLRDPSPGQIDTVTQPSTTLGEDDGQSAGVPLVVSGPWTDGDAIDARYTCDGKDVSPSLSWSGGPTEAAAYAVVLTDLDATEYAHWVVANIPVDQASLPERYNDPLAVLATNSRGSTGYAGPCPPVGTSHTYQITVYALSQILEAQTGDPAPGLIAAIESAAIESASTLFTYSR